MDIIVVDNGSDSKTVANFDSGGSKGPYRTDVFNDSYTLVEFSKDAKENYDGPSAMENFWGKPVEEAQVAKLEPLLTPKQESNVGSLQNNEGTMKDILWKNMVKKVEAKKSTQSRTPIKKPASKEPRKPFISPGSGGGDGDGE